MANKILTIEIGTAITKICEMDYKAKKPVIYQCFHVPTPPGALDDGVVDASPELVSAIQTALAAKKIKTKKVVYTVASNKIANREVEVPAVKEQQIKGIVFTNAQEYFPVELSQYDLSFKKVDTIEENGTKKFKLQVYATPQYLIESYRELSAACGLQIQAIDFVGNSISHMFIGEVPEGVHLVVKIDDSSCLLTVFNNGKISFQRSVSNGIDSAVKMLQNVPEFQGKMPYTEALRRFRTTPIIQSRFLTQEERQAMQNGMMPMGLQAGDPMITNALKDLVNGISRTIDYYNAQNSQAPIQDLYLTGIGAELIGMRELLTSELGRAATVLQRYQNIKLDGKIANTSVGAYVACIGAGFAPLQDVAVGKKAKSGSAAAPGTIDVLRVGVIGGVGCVMVAIALAVTSILPYFKQVDEYNEMVDRYSRLVDTQKMLAHYDVVQAAHQDFMQAESYIYSQNDEFLEMLSELEIQFPSNCKITSLSASNSEISMNIEAATLEDMGNCLQKLRYFKWFQTVYTNGFSSKITEEEGEITDIVYTFTVVCTPVAYGEEKLRGEALSDIEFSTEVKTEYDEVDSETTGEEQTDNSQEEQEQAVEEGNAEEPVEDAELMQDVAN